MSEAAAPSPAAGRLGTVRLLSDARLARRATKGDARAFEEIYNRYQQDLYGFCLAMVGNPQDAQEALQNTMVKVLRALPGEERTIKLKPWLYRIARNESVETMRKRREGVEIDAEQTPAVEQIAATVEARERLRELIDDLRELPERQRSALVMRELSGLDFEQIGAAFESSAAVARQTVYEARLSLRQMEAGREMSCEQVMRELSDADGRVTRRRELRAHLKDCADCRAFRDNMASRQTKFASIAPLPAAASAALLNGVLSGTASAAAGAAGAGAGAGAGVAATVGAGAGNAVTVSAIAKSAAAVAVVAAAGVTAADRGGLIDVPLPGDGGARQARPAHGLPGSGSGSSSPAKRGSADGGNAAAPADGGRAGNAPSAGGRSNDSRANGGRKRKAKLAGHARRGRRKPRGHGKSKGRGRPATLPPAADHGQERATERKAPQAQDSPGPGASGGSGGGGAPSEIAKPPRPSGGESGPPTSAPVEPGPGATQAPGKGASSTANGSTQEATEAPEAPGKR